jgi:hypothetical protein
MMDLEDTICKIIEDEYAAWTPEGQADSAAHQIMLMLKAMDREKLIRQLEEF